MNTIIIFNIGDIIFAKAQLSKYNELTEKKLNEMCLKKKVNITEITNIQLIVNRLFLKSIEANGDFKAFKTNKHCLGYSLQEELHKEMNVVKRCIEGTISLDDNATQILVEQSERKLCAFSRFGKNILFNTSTSHAEMFV